MGWALVSQGKLGISLVPAPTTGDTEDTAASLTVLMDFKGPPLPSIPSSPSVLPQVLPFAPEDSLRLRGWLALDSAWKAMFPKQTMSGLQVDTLLLRSHNPTPSPALQGFSRV